MKIKYLIKKAARRCVYGVAENSESFVTYLRRMGVSIGDGTVFYDPTTTTVDTQNPQMLKIGNNVRITKGVTILTHDYSWSVLSGVYGECLGGVAGVTIGNNVFVGVNAVILKGSKIGNNVIIGAGSVVSHYCEDNAVYAGVPARKICTLKEFYYKKKGQSSYDVKNILKSIDVTSILDVKHYLREYSCLVDDVFSDEEKEKLMKDTGYFELCRGYYQSHNVEKIKINEAMKPQ